MWPSVENVCPPDVGSSCLLYDRDSDCTVLVHRGSRRIIMEIKSHMDEDENDSHEFC